MIALPRSSQEIGRAAHIGCAPLCSGVREMRFCFALKYHSPHMQLRRPFVAPSFFARSFAKKSTRNAQPPRAEANRTSRPETSYRLLSYVHNT